MPKAKPIYIILCKFVILAAITSWLSCSPKLLHKTFKSSHSERSSFNLLRKLVYPSEFNRAARESVHSKLVCEFINCVKIAKQKLFSMIGKLHKDRCVVLMLGLRSADKESRIIGGNSGKCDCNSNVMFWCF